jgi:proteasome-associated ATPase
MDQFQVGDEVFLTHELNAILGKSPEPRPRHGETAVFDRMDGDQLVLRHRDDQILAWPAQYMTAADLKTGDRVLWDRNTFLVYDVIAKADPYALNELPDVRPEAVGGQDQILSRLLSVLTAVLVDPAKAALYGLAGKQSILMYGPPGCGKTLMARVAAARVGQLSGRKVRFFRVKPCEWESPWVGMTETHIRELFASLREAAHDGLAVLFLDEVESMGRQRGGSHSRHDDDALAALLAELDGFEARGNVAVIAATNRKDLIDSALLERLSDVEVHVPRPDMRGARSIFSIHLPDSLPYSPNGELANTTRKEIIETAVARLYSPNSDAARLCTLRFKDGSVRNIAARELASGRLIEQMCRAARHAACLRDVNGGPPGVAVRDIEEAVESAVERLATTLTVRNVHSYLSDVPTDMDVVAVEPVSRKLKSPRRFMHSPRSQEVHHG